MAASDSWKFTKVLNMLMSVLSHVNIRFYKDSETTFQRYGRFLYIIPSYIINFTSMIMNTIMLIREKKLLEVLDNLPSLVTQSQALFTAVTFFWKSDEIKSVVDELYDLWQETELSPTQRRVKQKAWDKMVLLMKFPFWNTRIVPILYAFYPVIQAIVCESTGQSDICKNLPFNCSYPFNPTQNWGVYILISIFQMYNFFMCCSAYISCQLIVVVLCGFLSIEFDLLAEKLKEIFRARDTIEDDPRINERDRVDGEIKTFIRRHQQLTALSSRLNSALDLMIFWIILFVGIHTCCFLVNGQLITGFRKVCCYNALIITMLWVLLICYYGEKLKASSLQLADVAYDMPFHELGLKNQKRFCLIIFRSQAPCNLNAMIYGDIDLGLFSRIVSTTWSYISLLNTVFADI